MIVYFAFVACLFQSKSVVADPPARQVSVKEQKWMREIFVCFERDHVLGDNVFDPNLPEMHQPNFAEYFVYGTQSIQVLGRLKLRSGLYFTKNGSLVLSPRAREASPDVKRQISRDAELVKLVILRSASELDSMGFNVQTSLSEVKKLMDWSKQSKK